MPTHVNLVCANKNTPKTEEKYLCKITAQFFTGFYASISSCFRLNLSVMYFAFTYL